MRTNRYNILRAPARFGPLAALAGCGLSVAQASLYESRDWALIGTLSTVVGYDSNLTFAHDGPEDTFFQASPQLSFARRNSSTDFHIDGAITGTEFLNGRQPGQLDYLAKVVYAYPLLEHKIPLYESQLSWQRSSEPNQYLGRRVSHDRTAFTGQGNLPLSGKLGVRGEADFYYDDYEESTLNRNSRWRGFAGLAYEKRPGLEASLNAGYARGESKPNDAVRRKVESDEVYVTARFRGELTAKLTGTVYGGIGEVKYKDGYENSHTLPVAGADLTWGIDPRRTLVAAVYSGADYAPDGQAIETTRGMLSFTHVIVGRWQYILRGGPTRTVFRREVRQATDRSWDAGAEFNYVPSIRFRVGLGLSFTTQDSDARDRQFDRSIVSLNSSYRF